MKGLHLENMATAPSPRKSASHLAISIPKGFQGNLLINSLATKLKQRSKGPSNKENAPRIISTKPPKQARKSSTVTRVSSKKEYSALNLYEEKDFYGGGDSRTGSGVSSIRSATRNAGRQPRIDSAGSDKLPHLSSRREQSSQGSRRTVSADSFRKASSHSGSGRLSGASTSFYPCSDSTGLAFESSGADHTIKVIKRDGVFQPIDKYAPGRQGGRELDQGCRGIACDYELFTLPLSCEDTAVLDTKYAHPVSRGKSDVSKKSMKVSWSHVMEHEHPGVVEAVENRADTTPTPVLFTTTIRPTSKDTMAFKRPVYCTGQSRIKSIGVKWTVPTLAVDEEDVGRQLPSAASSTPSKPMWSWLVTPEPIKLPPSRVKSVGQLSRASKSKESPSSSIGRSSSMFDIRTQHCRDVHPVATAMDKQGTSVTRTKWHVPSSTSSTLNAKQVAMDRLQMVKRPGKRLIYENPRDDFDIALKFRFNDNDNYDEEEDEDDVDDIDGTRESGMKTRPDDDDMTSSTTKREDTNSSPTKSRSTFH